MDNSFSPKLFSGSRKQATGTWSQLWKCETFSPEYMQTVVQTEIGPRETDWAAFIFTGGWWEMGMWEDSQWHQDFIHPR